MRLAWSLVGMLAVGLACTACQQSASPPAGAAKSDAARAAESLDRGDYGSAAALYQRAVTAEPGNLALHYGLGVSASHLGQRDLAVRELTWVLAHGDPGSDAVRAARRWLAAVGALPDPAAPVASAPGPEPQERPSAAARPGSVHGRALFGEAPGSVTPMARMQLFLKEYPSAENYFRLRTDEQGYFRFDSVPPGTYQLTERIAGPPTWRLRVEVRPGEDIARDLTPENSTKIRDDFPRAQF